MVKLSQVLTLKLRVISTIYAYTNQTRLGDQLKADFFGSTITVYFLI